MSTSKQLIERELKFNERYQYIEIVRGSIESGQVTCCDNCGKIITNMVKVMRMSDGQRFTIGTDCTETLSKAQCMYNGVNTDYYMDLYSYNKCARLVTEIKKGCEVVADFIWLTVTTAKGKRIEASKSDMEKFFPQFLNY